MNKLIAYLVVAMLSWSGADKHKYMTEEQVFAFRTAVATDIATVTLDSNEQPLFPGDMTKAETATQVASMAFWEGGLWSYVDDGSCNSFEWKKEHKWSHALCDGGRAWSLWQVQTKYQARDRTPHDGIKLLDDGGWTNAPDGYTGKDLVADRKVAIRVALHMMRQSLKTTGGLCGYTGDWAGGCAKAKQRREHAHHYFVTHPFQEN